MAGELQINGEYAGPWKLVASNLDIASADSAKAYTTTQYKRLLFRMSNRGASNSTVFPIFNFLNSSGTALGDGYVHRTFVSYGTGYYSNQQNNSSWSPGWISTNLRYSTTQSSNIFQMLFFNLDSNNHAGYIAQWSYRTSTNVRVSGFGSGWKYINTTTNPVYGIEMTISNLTYVLNYLNVEVYGDTTLT